MCYSKQFENHLLNELGVDDEQSMSEKDLKDEIDGIDEKIRVLTEEKKKREVEYQRIRNLKKFGDFIRDDSIGLCKFEIISGCKYDSRDTEQWTNIVVDGDISKKITIRYPMCLEFDKELRELIYKYLNKVNEGVLEG